MRGAGDKNINIVVALALLAAGCKKPYTPPAVAAPNNYLVVEGVIAAGQDSTVITLSRSVNIGQKVVHNPEAGATVTVQSDQNTTYALTQADGGRYVTPPLNLDNNRKYKLLIKTADGRTYESDYEPVKVTPAIDTLGYNVTADGLSFYTNAHDDANNTRFYRWDYAETYIYESAINALYKYVPNVDMMKVSVLRAPDEQIHICYVTINSSSVILNSSARLTQDVINNNPILKISNSSEKIFYRYSILVRQYALTKAAYEFWSVLGKNTEKIGTIFDVQPSEVTGNLHCTSNPAESVIGYLSISTIAKKRIFIDRRDLPAWPFNPPQCLPPGSVCWLKTAVFPIQELIVGDVIPLDTVREGGCEFSPGYVVKAAQYDCADCRYHFNGKTAKPAFWK